jgi:hypothetical protein
MNGSINVNNTLTNELKAYEFIESEFNKSILAKISNKEKLFEVIKDNSTEIKKRRRRKVEKVETQEERENEDEKIENEEESANENLKQTDEEIVIKPKTVRVNPGFNPTTGNIIINNYYNIINTSSETPQLSIVQNISHQFKNDINVVVRAEREEISVNKSGKSKFFYNVHK